MSFWDKVQAGAKMAGDATKVAAQKAKLQTDMLLIDREIQNRKKALGVAMYDHVSPLSQSQDFYAATDDLTNILRPALINAQKEILALAAKRVKLKEALAAAEAKRAGSFPTKAEGVGQKMMNFGKAGVMHSSETKTKAELAIVDRQIKSHKQKFGLELFGALSDAEDTKGYLPTDRQVRNIYDTCRGDIQRMEANKKAKAEELTQLGGSTNDTASTPSIVEYGADSDGFQTGAQDSSMQSSSSAGNNTRNSTGASNMGSYLAPQGGGFSDDPSNGQDDLLL